MDRRAAGRHPRADRLVTARFAVRRTPRAAANRVDGVAQGVLLARVTAPPIDGQANAALARLLADELGVGRTSVRIAAGATARRKLVEVDVLDAPALRSRWPGLSV